MAAVGDREVIGDGRPAGTVIGRATTELLGFYGVASVDQPSAVTAVTTTAATSTTNAYGYVTAAQADAIVTAVNAIIAQQQELGLMA